MKQKLDNNHYCLELANGKQQVVDYNELINMINKDEEEAVERWTYGSIDVHQWSQDPNQKGKVDVLISWEGYEEPTWEPMEVIKRDDPVTLAKYAIEKNLSGQEIWNWAQKYQKNLKSFYKKVRKMLNNKRAARGIKYQFGIRLLRNVREAYQLDKHNGNTKWGDAIAKEVSLLKDDFTCFWPAKANEITDVYDKVPVIWAFAVKFDGHHRARACAGGHKTRDPIQDLYSGVVELETIRITLVVAAVFDLKVVAADVTSAYIQANTIKKTYITAGEEFREWAGLQLVIMKALYGLKLSGAM